VVVKRFYDRPWKGLVRFLAKENSGFGQDFGMDREFSTHEVRLAMLPMIVMRSCVISRAQSAISNVIGST
jgi:hypothetical protein